ncbi:hypothetical protein PGT21_017529 [Puccinia graminis f. sp. tritici]|uniref:Uncharacterized protein n=1 Tax=Puccinia graminis f. sp. tritici TaxID=56615 RepID=A0A5B0QRC0_PUCGR|nr:hypothetical protein PGT21_017529 [Puccinia graminis f. sp. tritici]KAA1115768.1 hypothetical protein PGTUg99_031141 [Puccinia graminis f. sp. tritici]
MILPSVITLAICLFLGKDPSFTYANSLAVRQGPVHLQALKAAPLGRRNLPGLDLFSHHGGGRKQHGHGSASPSYEPHGEYGNDSSSYGQDSYDPSKGAYGSGNKIDPTGSDNGQGAFDLGTGTHHALQEGTLDSGDGGYTASDPGAGISPEPNASANYGPKKDNYHSEPEKKAPSTEDNDYATPSKTYNSGKGSTSSYQDPYSPSSKNSGKKDDSGLKDLGEYKQPPPEDNSKSSSGTDYYKKKNPKYHDKYASPHGKQKNGNDGKDENSDQDGSFIFESGTTEEQRKAAQKEANKDGAFKKGGKNDEGKSSYGGPVDPSNEKTYSGDQSYKQPNVTGGQKDSSPYA